MGIIQTDNFIHRLKKSSNPLQVCFKEKEYLDSNYKSIPTRKKSYSQYRKTIETSDYSTDDKDKFINVFSLTKGEYSKYKDDYKRQVAYEHDNQKPLYNHDKYIEKAISLFDSKTYPEQVIGFAALTGRRVAEIGSTARFAIASPNELMFSGQLKLKDNSISRPYKIPVLTHSFDLVKRFDEFREKYTKYLSSPEKFHNNNSRYISQFTKKHFSQFVDDDIKPKDLRAIYATISSSIYKPINQTSQRYFALILGHSEDDLVTCNSYFDFRLAS